MPPSSPSVLVVSCAGALMAVQLCGVPAAKLGPLHALKLQSISMEVLPIPPHVTNVDLNPKPSLQIPLAPPRVEMTGPLPVTLPPFQLPPNFKRKYGLLKSKPELLLKAPLQQQLSQFKAWCINPIQLDRPTVAMSAGTYEKQEQNLSLFLGHCLWLQGVEEPNMGHFLDPRRLCSFISLKIAHENTFSTILTYINTMRHVLKWWAVQPGGEHPSLQQALTWLSNLAKQVRWNTLPVVALACMQPYATIPT